MAEEDLDVMRRWCDTWNHGDIDAFADLFDADAEVITDPSFMEAEPFKGRAAIRKWFEGFKESWQEGGEVALRELFEIGDKVVLRFDWRVRGRTSGIETELDVTGVNPIRKGRIVHQQYYFDHAAALEAVGLSEQGRHADP